MPTILFYSQIKKILTCQGQFPGLASTPPITRVIGDLPHDPGPGEGGRWVGGLGPVMITP